MVFVENVYVKKLIVACLLSFFTYNYSVFSVFDDPTSMEKLTIFLEKCGSLKAAEYSLMTRKEILREQYNAHKRSMATASASAQKVIRNEIQAIKKLRSKIDEYLLYINYQKVEAMEKVQKQCM